MALFSWFTGNKKQGSPPKKIISFEQEVAIFKNNTMWPIAKVRKNTIAKQHDSVKNFAKKQSKHILLAFKRKTLPIN